MSSALMSATCAPYHLLVPPALPLPFPASCLGGSHRQEQPEIRWPRSPSGSTQTELCLPMGSPEVSLSFPESNPTGVQASTHSLPSYHHPSTYPPPLHLSPLLIHLPSIHLSNPYPSLYPATHILLPHPSIYSFTHPPSFPIQQCTSHPPIHPSPPHPPITYPPPIHASARSGLPQPL